MKSIKNIFLLTIFKSKHITEAFAFYILIMLLINNIYCIKLVANSGIVISSADVYIMFLRDDFFPISICTVSALLLLNLFKNDFRTVEIISYNSRKSIWLNQVLRVFMLSMCWGLLLIAFLFIFTVLFCREGLNFFQESSLFFFYTKRTLENINVQEVILFSYLSFISSLVTMCLLVLLFKWLCNSYVLGYIAMVLIICNDTINENFRVFFDKNSIFYTQWIDKSLIARGFSTTLLIIFLEILFGIIIAQKRDFINDK